VSQVREQGAVVGRGRASWEGSGGGGDEKGGSGVRRSRNGGGVGRQRKLCKTIFLFSGFDLI